MAGAAPKPGFPNPVEGVPKAFPAGVGAGVPNNPPDGWPNAVGFAAPNGAEVAVDAPLFRKIIHHYNLLAFIDVFKSKTYVHIQA